MALYTKYRPHDWDSLIGQDTISAILRTSLIQNAVGHAYILTGSRGTGKTTTARILAEGVNCKDLQNGNPCHKCSHCIAFENENMLDCIEIDGASNNGVENVRDLIEKARFEPNQGKYKIYIIDEVHMLSSGAFNALLKILEEPPDHVKFILATTEIDKVPDTIKSRSLRFDFKKITEADIIKRLEFVCKEEGIKVDKEALEIIARAARGGLRDALTLTEQNTVNNEISTEYVRSTLSLIEDSLIDEIIETIITSDKESMIRILDTLRQRHTEVRSLFDQILYSLRDRMLDSFVGKNTNNVGFHTYSQIFSLFESAYSNIKVIPDGWLLIEITLLRAVARDDNSLFGGNEGTQHSAVSPKKLDPTVSEIKNIQPQETKKNSSEGQNKIETIQIKTPSNTQDTPKEPQKDTPKEPQKDTPKEPQKTDSNFSYIRLLEEAKKIKASLVPDLKTARFELSGNMLILIFSKEWHYNRVNKPDMKNLIAEMLQGIYSENWTIECRLEGSNGANIMNEVF